jgi:hypothetical protein
MGKTKREKNGSIPTSSSSRLVPLSMRKNVCVTSISKKKK